MFTEILKDEKLKGIIKTFKKEGRGPVFPKIDKIVDKLVLKNNEFSHELSMDKTILRFFKIKKLRVRAQEGHSQLNKFSGLLLEEFRTDKVLIDLNRTIVDLLNLFEQYIIRLKERETAILQLIAGMLTLVIALIAIFVSIFT